MTHRYFLALAAFATAVGVLARPAHASSEPALPEQAEIVAHRAVLSFEGLDDLTLYIMGPAELAPQGHKVLLYFVGGGQEDEDVERMFGAHIAHEAVNRGYIFVSPAAPCRDCTFVARGEQYFPALFDQLRELIPMAEDRFHLMGFSNGGRSSLHIATRHPEYVASITTYPGYLRNQKYELLENLNDICVAMYVGRQDAGFYRNHQNVVRHLKKLGHPVHEKVFPREGHNIDALWTAAGAKTLMDGVENGLGCPARNAVEGSED